MRMRLISSFIVVPVILAAALAVPRAQRGASGAGANTRTKDRKPDC